MKNLLKFMIFFVSLFVLQACSNTYSAKAIEAWVVDEETKKPLEGAIVVAHWELRFGLEGGGAYQLQIMETVTDKNGKFYFPPWGPKRIPEDLPYSARLKDNDPGIGIYYPQYGAQYVSNHRPIRTLGDHGDSVRTSEWNGKTIEMKPLNASRKEYVRSLESFTSVLHFIGGKNCEWSFMPRLIAALIKENEQLPNYSNDGIEKFFRVTRASIEQSDSCGPSAELIKGYLK